jgi:plasmid stabilization system protein ParE
MKPPFVLTPSAERDLNEIWEYIANDRIAAADRVLKALGTAMRRLARTPGIGHLHERNWLTGGTGFS